MYRTLIVPLDGSATSELALPCVALMASATGAAIELVRVHHLYALEPKADREWVESIRRDEADYLARTAAYAQLEVACQVSFAVLEGPVVDAICDYARERDGALIVMSTHGRTGFSRLWFGSVADGVMHHTSSPVLLVRPPREASESAELPLPRGGLILVPLDGSDFAEQVLPHAVALSHAIDGEIFLLQVVQPMPAPAPQPTFPYALSHDLLGGSTRAVRDRADQYLSGLARTLRLRHAPVTVEYGVQVSENPATAIIECVHARAPAAVALATHGRGASRLLMGSVADKVLRGGPRVVLLLRPQLRDREAPAETRGVREIDVSEGGVRW